jgi:hypothetical protein
VETFVSRWTTATFLAASAACLLLTAAAAAAEPNAATLAVRLEPFILAPAHTPSAVAVVCNRGQADFSGSIRIEGPAEWQIAPETQPLALPAGQTRRVVFTVRRGTIRQDNAYPLTAVVAGGGGEVKHSQVVSAASAPYGKPKLDGTPQAFQDALPLSFTTRGRRTSIATLWNRRQFAIQVAVQQDRQVPWPGDAAEPSGPAAAKPPACDAVQLAFAVDASPTPASPDAPCGRCELLLVGLSNAEKGKCFLLASPETKLAAAQTVAPLGPRALDDVEVVVRRRDGWTYYQCLVPFRLLAEIKPGEGREFSLAVLVHDPNGTGLRDLGAASGLWPWQRSRTAWSRWPGDALGPQPPCDSRFPWGMCSSKY